MTTSPSHVYFPKLDLSLLSKRPSRDAETKFPCKLHRMLQDVENEGLTHIISWHKDGQCFRVHEPEIFVEKILPRYFKKSKYRSFQRQLNLYGFHRITALKPFWESCYAHPDFSRDDELGCRKINRPLRRKPGSKVTTTAKVQVDSPSSKSTWIEDTRMDEFFLEPMQSNKEAVTDTVAQLENHLDAKRPVATTPTVEDEDSIKKEIYDVTYNEHALTRRNSYQDLCESIMGADCEACKDGARLMDEIMRNENLEQGFSV